MNSSLLPKSLQKRFISVDIFNTKLKELPSISVEIPKDELKRLKSLFPEKISNKTLEKLELLEEKSENNSAPIITQIPAKILVNGVEKDFTIQTLQEVMEVVNQSNNEIKKLFIENVSDDVLNTVWNSHLKVWSSSCLQDSKQKSYTEQKEFQKEVMGKNSELYGDAYLAFVINYIVFREDLVFTGNFMRLNSQTEEGDSHQIYTSGVAIELGKWSNAPILIGGIGASFIIE